ncbi:recombinase family protein [Desulfofarcimen acetoxidans]|uniref:recombinase family protein n=1 Tax=Desulfofarcimen acetoxidans TaxID=58138 RepID=UPI0005A974F5|nr:recombinase family protein [Desulfofarcimen acetoxidans]
MRLLKKEQVLTPGNYYYSKTGILLTNVDTTRHYDWSGRSVADILEDEVYLRHTISLKSTTISYKNKKRIKRPTSEQLRFENIHEPPVNRETWDIVQDIRKNSRLDGKGRQRDLLPAFRIKFFLIRG